MKRSQLISIARNKPLGQKNGFTLVELLVAITMIPILLLSAGIMYLNTANAMSDVFNGGQVLSEKTNVMATLTRLIQNGQSASTPISSSPCASPSPPNCDRMYQFTVNVPNPPSPSPQQNVYILWVDTDGKVHLEYSQNGASGPFSQISYANLIVPPPLPGSIDPMPFVVDTNNRTVTVNLKFASHPESMDARSQNYLMIPVTKIIPMQGGDGVG